VNVPGFLKNWLFLLFALILSTAVFAKESLAINEIRVEALPPEAKITLELIRRGGPFPYKKDGSVFGNYEGNLPKQRRGYYREYTVETPGSRNRGARRIVAGGETEVRTEFYYTDDHYRSFKRIRN
jgi:ribonuclease T1